MADRDSPIIAERPIAVPPRRIAPLALDITRLVCRPHHPTPTGIDRVEFAWARHLLNLADRPVAFHAWVPGLGHRSFARAAVAAFIDQLGKRWHGARVGDARAALARLLAGSSRARLGSDATVLSLSHQRLHEARAVERSRPAHGRLLLFIHDAIPCTHPEYALKEGTTRHEARMRHAFDGADGIIVNSGATAASLRRYAEASARDVPMLVAPFGIDTPGIVAPAAAKPERPTFLCIGTIEPRKNHLLLLHSWRRMAETLAPKAMPRLIVVGRRGWENEMVVDLLDRCAAIHPFVEERGRVGDGELASLMASATALLMPSFAEGYGLPVAEALAAGTPVIAADLPVYREFAGDVPTYLDPLDGPAWIAAIRDYAQPGSSTRAAQMARLAKWRRPEWSTHFAAILAFADTLA